MTDKEKIVRIKLLKVGVNPANNGFDHLAKAIVFVWENPNIRKMKQIYPAICSDEHIGRAERAMRLSIERLYKTQPLSQIYSELYTLPNYESRKLTISSFIFSIVEQLKIEYD